MPTVKTDRRSERRFQIPLESQATIEFDWPSPAGPRARLRLVDLSVSSLSFTLNDEIRTPEAGTDLSGAVIRLGECRIHGEIVVMHVSPAAGGAVCGAIFFPASDDDLVKIKSVIAGFETLQGD